MPGGDRTGPLQQGPMTGRRMGFCSGYNSPGYANQGAGRFFGRGFGREFGRGFRWRTWDFAPVGRAVPVQSYATYPQQPTKEQELSMLKEDSKAVEEEQKALNEELDAIKKRIAELESKQQ